MGIEIVLEDERGTKLASLQDVTNILHRVLPKPDDQDFRYLNCVDWYGDTTFNRNQIPEVRQELKRLASVERSVDEIDLIGRLDALAEKAETEPHLYLKFYGD